MTLEGAPRYSRITYIHYYYWCIHYLYLYHYSYLYLRPPLPHSPLSLGDIFPN